MTEPSADATVIKSIRRKVNGKKTSRAPRVTPVTLAWIEETIGKPINYMDLYEWSDPLVIRKLFASAAAQQLRDFVNQQRAKNPEVNIIPLVEGWRPTVKRRGKNPVTKAAAIVATMSTEEKDALRQLLNE